jgi:hypothetical protein
MSDTKSKFSAPSKYPATARVLKSDLRALSTALVGLAFNAEIARLVVDVTNADALILFRLTAEEFAALPATHVHPDDIVDHELRASVQADSGWFKRYENLHLIDQSSMKELKSWLLAVLPIDIVNKCITDAGGEGLELRPAYTVRTMIPRIISALEEQKPTELRALKAAIEKPYELGMETLESWLTNKQRLAAVATGHLDYTFNDSDLMLGVWSGLAHLHLAPIATFKQAWTTANRLAVFCHSAILLWERDMVESEQPVFEATRASAGFSATRVPAPAASQSSLHGLMSSAKVTKLAAEDSALLQRFLEAGLATIAHKHANPGFVVPPHACVTHGICFHTATECKSKPK